MNDAELLDYIKAEAVAAVVTLSPATLARLLVIAGYDGMAAHHEMLRDRRAVVEVTGPNLLDLVRDVARRSGPERASIRIRMAAGVSP